MQHVHAHACVVHLKTSMHVKQTHSCVIFLSFSLAAPS